MDKLKVLLIEPNRLLRIGIVTLLGKQNNVTAMALAGDLRIPATAKEFAPHVVLIDPGPSISKLRKLLVSIQKHLPLSIIVVVNLLPMHATCIDHVGIKVSGYVRRNASLEEFLHTIRTAAVGARILSSTSQGSVPRLIIEDAIRKGCIQMVYDSIKMSDHETKIVVTLGLGNSIESVATQLGFSIDIAKAHLRNALDKIALYSQIESIVSPLPSDLPATNKP